MEFKWPLSPEKVPFPAPDRDGFLITPSTARQKEWDSLIRSKWRQPGNNLSRRRRRRQRRRRQQRRGKFVMRAIAQRWPPLANSNLPTKIAVAESADWVSEFLCARSSAGARSPLRTTSEKTTERRDKKKNIWTSVHPPGLSIISIFCFISSVRTPQLATGRFKFLI